MTMVTNVNILINCNAGTKILECGSIYLHIVGPHCTASMLHLVQGILNPLYSPKMLEA